MADEYTDPNAVLGDGPPEDQAKRVEHDEVKKLMESYDQARRFDKAARKQYALDRRYASGTADLTWAVTTNLIGAYIDILVSYLYARDPDVSVRKAERLQNNDTTEDEDFARTLELVIARLWKDGRLKKSVRKMVRSALSCGPGWIKVVMQIDRSRDPVVEAALNDAQDNLAAINAQQRKILEGEAQDREVAIAELERKIQGLMANVEVITRKGLAIDFMQAEDVQVSLDQRHIEDYLESDWIGNSIYVPKSELAAKFPRLTSEQVKSATCYYQRQEKDDHVADPQQVTERDAEQFTENGPAAGGDDQVEFARVIEIWDKRDNHIKTMVQGVPCWAREPYPPPQASRRFYPYFYLAFYEVDGARHPQSLPFRLRKLQDEYSAARSNFRKTRERAVPGTIFNAEQIDRDNAQKLEQSTQQEFVGIVTTNPNIPFRDLFAEKPVARVDPMLFDVEPILRDMEKVSGVQESLQASVVQPKTATEAEIQQSGFAARASTDRDTLEDVLVDLAQYTAELALQTLNIAEVQRMVGPLAFWPAGMAIEDIITMVEVDIAAGSTGKPNTAAERESWSIALPLIKETMMQVAQMQAMGNVEMANCLIELLRETLNRLGDRIDAERFIPQPMPVPPMAGMPGAPVPGTPGVPPVPLPPGAPADDGLPPEVPTEGVAERLPL